MWRRIKDIEFERIRIFCNCAGTIDSEKFIEIDKLSNSLVVNTV
uniref:Hydrogenase iron-sulfur subunit n=1 Tax=Heterorhabditis bacteriophora TaxID=37862 RepID=A0A1I7WA90_HETBA